jgi:hypothetical protein
VGWNNIRTFYKVRLRQFYEMGTAFSSLSPAAPAVPPYLGDCEKVGFHRRGKRRKGGERFSSRRAVPSHLVYPFSPLSPAAPAVPPYLGDCEKVGFHRRGNRRKRGERICPRRVVPSHLVPAFSPLSPAAPAVPPYLAACEEVGFHRRGESGNRGLIFGSFRGCSCRL